MYNYDFTELSGTENDLTWGLTKVVLRVNSKLQDIPMGKALSGILTQIVNLLTAYDFNALAEWNNIPGFVSVKKVKTMQSVVKELPSNSEIVELGCYKGRSAVALASVLPEDGVLHCIDHFVGSPTMPELGIDDRNLLTEFRKNVAAFGVDDKIKVLEMKSAEAVPRFEPESIDAIFIDAAHDYESVKEDLLSWYPKVKPGGFIFCDDYEPSWPGVVQAVKDVGLEGVVAAPNLWMHQKAEK